MPSGPSRIASLLFIVLIVFASIATADWPHNATVNLPVCTAGGNQINPKLVEDGSGGAIVVWQDNRIPANDYDIYAQHILASGVVDPAWPINGRLMCGVAGAQTGPLAISDGAGGALVVWADARGAASDIYATRVLASGAVDPAWPLNGLGVCTAGGAQTSPAIVTDGATGAIIAWTDARAGNTDIYAHHILRNGTVDAAWPVDGRGLVTEVDPQSAQTMCSDGAGGAIVAWTDARGLPLTYVFAQHVLASGAVDPLWAAQGKQISDANGGCQTPAIVSDAASGAIVTWAQFASGSYDVRAQHVLSTGALDSYWSANGIFSAGAQAFDQLAPAVVPDGAGGGIITWHDARSVNDGSDYAQHLTNNGQADTAWPMAGSRVGGFIGGDVQAPVATSDGAGGMVAAWQRGSTHIYAKNVRVTGAVDAVWPSDGQALCLATQFQSSPAIATDGNGGAIVAWVDTRGGTSDIYAQRIARFAYLGTPEAVIADVRDVSGDQGGKVKLSWNGSYLDANADPNLSTYEIYRSVGTRAAMAVVTRGVPVSHGFVNRPPSTESLISTIEEGATHYWEFVGSQAPLHYITNYSSLYSTGGDSTSSGNPKTMFMIVARNAAGSMYWLSAPDSGYSVDNLPPSAPASLSAAFAAGVTQLHWNRSFAADLAGYRLYRGATSDFVPSAGNLIGSPTDTLFVDNPGGFYYYRVSAADVHGNEGGSTLAFPSGTTDVPPIGSLVLVLEGARPNPALRGELEIRFTLPRTGSARLELLDLAGRTVVVRDLGTMGAGTHTVNLGEGAHVSPGLYLVRLRHGTGERLARVSVLQ